MTNRRSRQFDRDVRDYQRTHPGTTLPEAREAVAARAAARPQSGLPARIPGAPLPRPGETLDGYTKRVAAAAGVHRHRAMELLGLAPGSSASRRLAELTRGRLPDHAVRALVAATGMTPAQARALTTSPVPAADAAAGLERLARQALQEKLVQRGGEGKTRTDARTLARLLAEAGARRPLLFDTDPPRSLDGWAEPAFHPVLVDLPWPAEGPTPPADPDLVDEILKELGI
ncbi:TniQ family protein, partial [Streptomyces lavenduligriseus]